MQYLVVGVDGKEYGPVEESALRQWASENRVTPQTTLKDFQTGHPLSASSVPGLFGPVPQATMAPAYAPAAPIQSRPSSSGDAGVLVGVSLRSVAAVVFFFFFKGLGLIFAGYALFYAIRAQTEGNKYGLIAILIAALALGAVGIGWMLRLSGTGV